MPSNTLLIKGEINVHLYREDDNVCICVADNGQGIIDKRQETYLRTFLSGATNFGKTGSGIGCILQTNMYIYTKEQSPLQTIFLKVPYLPLNCLSSHMPVKRRNYFRNC